MKIFQIEMIIGVEEIMISILDFYIKRQSLFKVVLTAQKLNFSIERFSSVNVTNFWSH